MQPLEWFCSRNLTIWHLLSCYCIFPAYSSQIPPALLVQIRICLSLAYKRNEKTLKLSLPRTFQTGLVTTTVLTYLFMKHWKRRMTSLWKRGEGQGTPPGSILSPCSHPGHFTPGSPYPIPPTPCHLLVERTTQESIEKSVKPSSVRLLTWFYSLRLVHIPLSPARSLLPVLKSPFQFPRECLVLQDTLSYFEWP